MGGFLYNSSQKNNEKEALSIVPCKRTKRMPESTAIISVEAPGQLYNQTNKFVYLGADVNHNQH